MSLDEVTGGGVAAGTDEPGRRDRATDPPETK
jgi:hypothetical protein